MLRRHFCIVTFIGLAGLIVTPPTTSLASAETKQAKFIGSLIGKAIKVLEEEGRDAADSKVLSAGGVVNKISCGHPRSSDDPENSQ